jgi:hypothetical protein
VEGERNSLREMWKATILETLSVASVVLISYLREVLKSWKAYLWTYAILALLKCFQANFPVLRMVLDGLDATETSTVRFLDIIIALFALSRRNRVYSIPSVISTTPFFSEICHCAATRAV